jgi:hypothetical protein
VLVFPCRLFVRPKCLFSLLCFLFISVLATPAMCAILFHHSLRTLISPIKLAQCIKQRPSLPSPFTSHAYCQLLPWSSSASSFPSQLERLGQKKGLSALERLTEARRARTVQRVQQYAHPTPCFHCPSDNTQNRSGRSDAWYPSTDQQRQLPIPILRVGKRHRGYCAS